mmetsp:Transcript_526/g.968  ORF Transcript_526/g.968 Transcript_526/m.968 type:complete len:185 (+) Transcript_526:2044-2598(+)
MNGQEREARYCARLAGGEDVSAVVREAVRDPLLFQFGEILSLDRVSEVRIISLIPFQCCSRTFCLPPPPLRTVVESKAPVCQEWRRRDVPSREPTTLLGSSRPISSSAVFWILACAAHHCCRRVIVQKKGSIRGKLANSWGFVASLFRYDLLRQLCNSGGQELYDLLVLYAYGNMKDYESERLS